jgi:hypothetical protein
MAAATETFLGTGLGYVRFLLEERREQLRALEEHRSQLDDYSSCRRSLEQTIRDLEVLLRYAERAEDSEGQCLCIDA